MANSLETRTPFLDRDVAEFALSLPVSLKVCKDQTKVVMRKACLDLWPEELRGRKKQGFGAPVGKWLALPEVKNLSRQVFASGGRLRELLAGTNDNLKKGADYKTWMLLILGLWLERNKVEV
jgi:asparagine synthase (glutamine-hydrolysing)